VTLDNTPIPTDISAPNNTIAGRHSLLSSSALQYLVMDLAAAGAESGLLADGPRIGPLIYTASAPDAGTLTLPLTLAKSGTPPVDSRIVAQTFNTSDVKLSKLDPAAGWTDITPPLADIALSAAPPQITVQVASGLAAGTRYRLTIESPLATPIVDTEGRVLQPQRFTRTFAFVLDTSGNLTLDPAV
jgi:hypothetical protein